VATVFELAAMVEKGERLVLRREDVKPLLREMERRRIMVRVEVFPDGDVPGRFVLRKGSGVEARC